MRPLRYFRWWLAVGWLLIVATIYLSLTAKPPVELAFDYGDKWGHLLAYAVLMGWFVQLYQRRNMLLFYALFLLMLGVVLEFLQGLTGRYFEYADMLANGGGVALGLLLLLTPVRLSLYRFEQRFLQE